MSLFERTGNNIFLTEAGHETYEFSRSIAKKFDDASIILGKMKGIKRGLPDTAATSTAQYIAPYLLLRSASNIRDYHQSRSD